VVLETYRQLLSERAAALAAADRQSGRLGNVRLLIVVAFLAALWYRQWWLAAADALLFCWLGSRIQRFHALRDRAQRAVEYYERSVQRVLGNWRGQGSTGQAHLPAEHLYARDLDLFGPGSLFELLSQARTRLGEQRLAQWLLTPATPAIVQQRQAAVQELHSRLDLREDLAVLTAATQRDVRDALLTHWGEAPPTELHQAPRSLYTLLAILGLIAVAALLADIFGAGLPYLRIYYLSLWLICGGILFRYRHAIHAVLHGAEGAAQELALLSGVLACLERQSFQSLRLTHLRQQLNASGQPASQRLAQLRRWMDFVDSRDHFLVRFLGPLVLWDLHLALALEDWRAKSGAVLRGWLEAAAEIEALSSLAAFHYENPSAVFPTLQEGAPHFHGEQLTHPLLPRDQAVANTVTLGQPHRLLVVSGSNMSGKSTLMRTVGVNAVLAQAGAPVFATRLTLTPLAIGASIATHDSLQGNISRFYAEILRLRDIMTAAAAAPVLFLIDEVLSGANSHDRRIGAAAILRGLLDRGAIGIVTTHDLALTRIIDDVGELAANVHFEDQLLDGKMKFDYRMRPGVVTHSNAIALMRAVGLEV
jgi:hypothetical protein